MNGSFGHDRRGVVGDNGRHIVDPRINTTADGGIECIFVKSHGLGRWRIIEVKELDLIGERCDIVPTYEVGCWSIYERKATYQEVRGYILLEESEDKWEE